MNIGTPTPAPPRYMYIDGGAIRGAIKVFGEYFNGEEIHIDWKSVGSDHSRIFYYDALPVRKDATETEAEFETRVIEAREKFDSMRKFEGFFVNYGVSLRRRQRIEQKRVDTMIATDILTHANRQLVPEITLITNDQDFYPVVLATMDTGVKVNLVCQSKKTNKEFMYATDSVVDLNIHRFHKWVSQNLRSKYPLPQRMKGTSSNRRISRSDQKTHVISETTDKAYEISINEVTDFLKAEKLSTLRKYIQLTFEKNDSVNAALRDLDVLIENNEKV